jgi:hypothetical protein
MQLIHGDYGNRNEALVMQVVADQMHRSCPGQVSIVATPRRPGPPPPPPPFCQGNMPTDLHVQNTAARIPAALSIAKLDTTV